MLLFELYLREAEYMPEHLIRLNIPDKRRFFLVPCYIVDNYIKLADGAALKLLLYMLNSDEPAHSIDAAAAALGLSKDAVSDAAVFWNQLGVMSDSDGSAPVQSESALVAETFKPSPEPNKQAVLHCSYSPKDIASMIEQSEDMRELFSEAEQTLGRILKHADHELLINLKDYYGFSTPSIVLILAYCKDREKTSARYIETVARDYYDRGICDFVQIDEEINRKKDYASFENQVLRDFGLDTRLTSRQTKYIDSWRDMGFDVRMVSLARERCVDATNKLSFEYINKILLSWTEKKIFTPDAAENDAKPSAKQQPQASFDINEFDRFTLGIDSASSGKENTP